MKAIIKSLLMLCAIASLSSLLTGCNTVEGAGQDIQAGGKAISHAANDAK